MEADASELAWPLYPRCDDRQRYTPREDDFACLKRLFPNVDQSDPPWIEIDERLTANGFEAAEIKAMTARRLLQVAVCALGNEPQDTAVMGGAAPGLSQYGPTEVLASGEPIELRGQVVRAKHPAGGYIEFPRDELTKRTSDEPENLFVAAQRFHTALWNARLDLYLELSPWIRSELRQVAGLDANAPLGFDGSPSDNAAIVEAHQKYRQGTRSGDPRIGDILKRANKEWHELTGLPWGLGTVDEWHAAAKAAGVPDARLGDFEFTKDAIRIWAIARKVKHHVPNQYQDDQTEGILKALLAIPTGHEKAHQYHSVVQSLLSELFAASLKYVRVEFEIHQGRKRVDIIYTNVANEGFFRWVALHYRAQNVFVECKNYATDVANPELDQLCGRFSKKRGQFGFLVCRSFDDKGRFVQRCRDTANDGRGYVIGLDDEDLKLFVQAYRSGDNDAIFENLKRRFDELVM